MAHAIIHDPSRLRVSLVPTSGGEQRRCSTRLVANTRRDAVQEFVVQQQVSMVCLQETKLTMICTQDLTNMLGSSFDYSLLPAVGLSGGILLAWRNDIWAVSHITSVARHEQCWWLTTVYGPVVDSVRAEFLDELDFNMILRAEDKSNSRVNRRVMSWFRRFLDDLSLSELHLNGRLFTWSNERDHPTLEWIDRAFLRALSDCSDHSPLLLKLCVVPGSERRFRFESIWTKFPSFSDVVKEAWNVTCPGVDPCRLLDVKLRSTAKALKAWSSKFVGSFDTAQELRSSSVEEIALRRQLKVNIARQRSRVLFLEGGDANIEFFHLQACHRSRMNFIQEIKVQGTEIVLEDAKAAAFYQFFQDMFGQSGMRSHSLQFDRLGLNMASLEGLDHCFTEEEVWSVVHELPNEKAPGPDGFTGLFFKSTWSLIKEDIMRVFNAFWSLDTRSLFLLNDAYLILLRKKPDAVEIRFQTDQLDPQLAPKLKDLISCNQSTFIKSRCIHDNFHAVQLTCKLLHRKKIPMVHLKVDLARAFNSVICSATR
ncbi:hypothetical protein BS78_01G089700 [Paspalum vaginatum]|nr:hypothetical protein BS78_01G089700 [Paspalum vaginatum]